MLLSFLPDSEREGKRRLSTWLFSVLVPSALYCLHCKLALGILSLRVPF